MRYVLIYVMILLSSCMLSEKESSSANESKTAQYALVIHGGAGTILKKDMSEEREIAYRQALNEALDIGEEMLKAGSESIDVVEKVIHYMEDSPLFNAGKGAVFSHEGKNELDASIMRGSDMNAGAVGGVSNVRYPISAARAVMERSEHVLLTGIGAEKFAELQGLEIVDPSYFYTARRWNSLQRILESEKTKLAASTDPDDKKNGTVGCVALDKNGNIVAGTSSGGMTNKRFNRFGDVPIIGAGTYADNATCGVSCTGHGEYFIRYAVAHDVSARMKYLGELLSEAADEVVNKTLKDNGGSGGLIAVDRYGNVAMPFNSRGCTGAMQSPVSVM